MIYIGKASFYEWFVRVFIDERARDH